MGRLLSAEATRWVSRRGLWLTLGVGVAIACLMAFALVMGSRPPSGEEVANGRRYFAEAHAHWEQNRESDHAACVEAVPASEVKQACDPMLVEPKEDDFVQQPLTWSEALGGGAVAGAALGGLLALVLGAGFWGAEYRQGTVSTWLTFVPDRTRVWASRFVVSAVAGALAAALTSALMLAAGAVAVFAFQGPAAVGDSGAGLAIAARGLGFGALMAVLGSGLAVLTRTTLVATAVPIAYLVLQSAVGLLYLVPGFEAFAVWLPEHNISAYLQNGTTFTVPVPRATDSGLTTDLVEKTVSFAQGLVYLVGGTGLAAAASLLVFRRRDVT